MSLTAVLLAVAASPLVVAFALYTAPPTTAAIRARWHRLYLRLSSHRYRRQLRAWKAGRRRTEPSLPRAFTMREHATDAHASH